MHSCIVSRNTRCLHFALSIHPRPYSVCASREGSGETARMCRLVGAFAARDHICDKYLNRLSWPITRKIRGVIYCIVILLYCNLTSVGDFSWKTSVMDELNAKFTKCLTPLLPFRFRFCHKRRCERNICTINQLFIASFRDRFQVLIWNKSW